MRNTLSVIIPNYCKAKYIKQCLDSILSQTLLPDEIIIVDDCSTDDSVKLIKAFEKDNSIIRLIVLPQNGGVSHARNVGLREARSEYVTFIDSDDYYYDKNKLYNEMKLIEDGKADIAYSNVVFVSEDGNLQGRGYCYKNNDEMYNAYLYGRERHDIVVRDYCVKRETVVSVGGYDEAKSLYEDLKLILELSKHCSFACTGADGTAYRLNTNGLSNQDWKKHVEVRCDIVREQLIDRGMLVASFWTFAVKLRLNSKRYKADIVNLISRLLRG